METGGKCASPENGSNKPKPFATGCDQLPIGAHGKEGVDGSSPSEGLFKIPANGHLVLPAMARFRRFAGTKFWDRRALAGTRDV